MPRHISLQDAAAARPFSYLAPGATSISHTKLHTESCTENACSQQRLLAHRFAPAPTIHISHLIHICTPCAVPCSCMGIHHRRRLWRHGRRQSLGRPWLWGGLCRARHEICDATILLHRMHSNNIFCCSASWPVSCRSDGHVFGIPTGEVSRMDGSGGTVIAAVLYCTGHGLSAPAVGCLLLSSDAIALFDAAASGHSCCCENRTSNDLLLGANITLSIQFVPPHLPLQSPPSHYPPSTFAPARGRSGRYFFVYFGFVDWIPEQQQQQQQQRRPRPQHLPHL